MRDSQLNVGGSGSPSRADAGDVTAETQMNSWTRPLAAAQRTVDKAEASPPLRLLDSFPAVERHAADRDECLPAWPPVLPAEMAQCSVCGLPGTEPRCAGCEELIRLHHTPVDTLEFLAVADERSAPEKLIRDWKDETTVQDGVVAGPHDWLIGIAAALSAYCQSHAERLLGGTPVITFVPSRAPLVASAFQLAADRGWFSLDVRTTGDRRGTWLQHETAEAQERLARTPADWLILPAGAPRGPVVLFDDMFVSGASMFAYAAALRQAGATEIRSVCVGRHVPDAHWDYWDAARILRGTGEFRWTPERAVIHRIAPVPAGHGRDAPAISMRAPRLHGGSRTVNGVDTQSRT